MSYVIATSISVNKNGNEIYVTGDDNNVFPKDYTRHKFNGNLVDLIYDLWGGNIQPINSANGGKALYIERIMSNKINVGWGGSSGDKVREIIREKELDKLFLRLWNDKTKANKKYKVMYGDSCIMRVSKYGFRYGSGNCKIFNFYQASNLVNSSSKNLQMVRV